jgi:hypothetical protein
MSEPIVRFKRPEIKSEFKLKKNIDEEMKMFQIYQLADWLSIQNFNLHFTKVTRKCIVEPCVFIHDLEMYNQKKKKKKKKLNLNGFIS